MAGRGRVDGTKIATLRAAKSYDQTEFATRLRKRGLGATQATVSRWENGQEPRAYALPAIAAELGVAIESLYADGEDEAESRGMGDHRAMLAALAVALEPFHPRAREASAAGGR